MNKTILLLFILLITATQTAAIIYNTIDMDADSQVRLHTTGTVSVAEDDSTISWYDDDGWEATQSTGSYSALTLNNKGITDGTTDTIYYYNGTHNTIFYTNGTLTHQAYSGANGTLVAVTDNWYVYAVHRPSTSDPGLQAVHRTTLANATNTSRLNGTQGYTDPNNWWSYYAQPQYNDDDLVISNYYYTKAGLYYNSFIALRDDDTNGPSLEQTKTSSNVNKGTVELQNDVCTEATYGGDWIITCGPGSYLRQYNADTNTATTYNYGAYSYYGAGEYNGDNHYSMVSASATCAGNAVHLILGDGTGTWPIDYPNDTPLYEGCDMNLTNATAAEYAKTGQIVYYRDITGGGAADITEEYTTEIETYAKTMKKSSYYTSGADLIRNYGNGTIDDSYSLELNIQSGLADEEGVYRKAYGDMTGSVLTLDMLYTTKYTDNRTIYSTVACDVGTGYDTNKYEPWNQETTQEVYDEYDFNTSYAVYTRPHSEPYSDYDEDVDADDTSKSLVFTSAGSTDPFTMRKVLYADGDGSYLQTIALYWNSTATITFTNTIGDELAEVTLNLNQSDNKWTATIDGKEVASENGLLNLGAEKDILISFTENGVHYDIDKHTGTIEKTLVLPVKRVTWTLHTPDQGLMLGPWAYYDDAITPDMQAATYAGKDKDNQSYYYHSCVYDDTDEHTIRITVGITENAVADTYTFRYAYDPDLNVTEAAGDTPPSTDDESRAAIQGTVCSVFNICTDNGRLLFALGVMIAVLIAAMGYMSEQYHQTAATQAVPFMLFALMFVAFAAFGFFPTWFTVAGAVAVAAVLAVKYSFFTAFGGRGGEA